MPSVEISPGIHWIGVNDHTTDLFEGLWPITREGVSYNSYLIMDEKKAVVDLAKSIKVDEYLGRLGELVKIHELDYIILNHLEPDHAGILKIIWKMAPQATLLCSSQAKNMISAFYGITERIQVVKDGEELPLGKKTLKFFLTPMVHWPETMVTYEVNSQILFSCDAFGGYGALQGAIFDDECTDLDFYEKEALRYYANIVAKFSFMVLKAIDKLSSVNISIIAPSHGLIWRKSPNHILELYRRWASYAQNGGDKGVVIVYGSMYGNTEVMMDALAQGIAKSGIKVEIFDVCRSHYSYILPALLINKGVVVGAPTYETALFPYMVHLLDMAVRKEIKHKKVLYFGSFGWSGGGKREFEQFSNRLDWEIIQSFEFQGGGRLEDFHHAFEMGREFGQFIGGS
ncbi:MAG: FprA family A-type flavoprotein [Candidatus Caldatribacteriaceae bacterium]